MSLILSIPGKTFLAGEYLALKEGPALVALSSPCFKLVVQKGSGKVVGLHPSSPAGVFISKHLSVFEKVDLSFVDPYRGLGGFGASTAQFLGAYAYFVGQSSLDLKNLMHSYYECAWRGEGYRPSGADLIGQYKGNLTFFDKMRGLMSISGWPFTDLRFFLIHTGKKLATHEHLKNLGEFNTNALEVSFQKIRTSFDAVKSDLFVEGIRDYSKALRDLNFTCDETLSLLADLNRIDGVEAAKGCGAMGADVILVVTQKNATVPLQNFCSSQGLSIVSSDESISLGLQIGGVL